MPARTDDVWHGFLPGASAGLRYGYRVYGPYDPLAGHRFNHHKLLIDPYTRQLDSELTWSDANYGFIRGSDKADLSFDTRDSAPFVPKCVVCKPFHLRHYPAEYKASRPWSESIIYEAHVKGFTARFPGVKSHRRGSYAAMASRPVVRYLQNLGVTAVELLPIHGFVDDHFLVEKGLINYWGYQSLTFMAPANRYATGNAAKECREMIAGLHRADLQVLLDVVYNHSCEGNELGPTLCYRGIDNRSYYRLSEDKRYYVNDSGTGNTFAVEHPRVMQLVLDSLRFWSSEMGVDGFRFDLASILGREQHGFDQGAGFFDAIAQDPVLASSRMIAEPWDLGPGGYRLGHYPQRWSEWNDQYRDTVRRFWLGERGLLAEFSKRLLGSSDLFERSNGAAGDTVPNRTPAASINFVTAHDGFTLTDLVSYAQKHNEANGEDNRDGHDGNHSHNHGVEGPSQSPDINSMRARQQRNILSTLLLSQGIPMLLAGDERGRSQSGNNNAYCQDNTLTWIDWQSRQYDQALLDFTQRLIALRHAHPVLRRPWYLHSQIRSRSSDQVDVCWLNADAETMSESDWHADEGCFLAVQLVGDALTPTARFSDALAGDTILMLFNAGDDDVDFPLDAETLAPGAWICELNTAESIQNSELDTVSGPSLHCESHSVLVARCYTA